jgi:hypothetical protein
MFLSDSLLDSLSLPLSLCFCLFLYVSICLCLTPILSLCFFSFSLSLYPSSVCTLLSISLTYFLSIYISIWLSLAPSYSLFIPLFQTLSSWNPKRSRSSDQMTGVLHFYSIQKTHSLRLEVMNDLLGFLQLRNSFRKLVLTNQYRLLFLGQNILFKTTKTRQLTGWKRPSLASSMSKHSSCKHMVPC